MITNIDEMRKHLCQAYDDLVKGEIDVKKAEALANMAGKMISSCKAEIDYKALVVQRPNVSIPFMDGGRPVEAKKPESHEAGGV